MRPAVSAWDDAKALSMGTSRGERILRAKKLRKYMAVITKTQGRVFVKPVVAV